MRALRTTVLVSTVFGALASASSAQTELLGRSPVDNVVTVFSARFVSADIDDILAVQDLGRIHFSVADAPARAESRVVRLVLLRLSGDRFQPVWHSSPRLATAVPAARLAANAWAVADIDRDGLAELMLFAPETCAVVSFEGDSVRTSAVPMPGAWVTDAVACDIDSDSIPEIVTIELSSLDSLLTARLVRAYRLTDSVVAPTTEYLAGAGWSTAELSLSGSARLEEHWGELPVLAGVYHSLRPSSYAVLFRSGDSIRISTSPFPWHRWFTKDRVLPAGPLTLFNVGDTLVAYGYFVPGTGRPGSSRSFAALQDGEWRLLTMTDAARHITDPVCRFTLNQVPGWLELRDDVFRFYPGEIFVWRPENR